MQGMQVFLQIDTNTVLSLVIPNATKRIADEK